MQSYCVVYQELTRLSRGSPHTNLLVSIRKGSFGEDEEEAFEANANLHMHLSILVSSLKTVFYMCRQNF